MAQIVISERVPEGFTQIIWFNDFDVWQNDKGALLIADRTGLYPVRRPLSRVEKTLIELVFDVDLRSGENGN